MYDVIIVGGGMAGFSAGLYASRARLKTVILEKQGLGGGQIAKTDLVENYPGFEEINGFELAMKCRSHAEKFGCELVEGVEVVRIDLAGTTKMVCTADGRTFFGKTVILAMGAAYRKLDVPGEDQFYGRGVSNCATCDAAFYRDRPVAVVGGGNAALEEGTFLTKFTSEVTNIHRRDSYRAEAIIQERAQASGMRFLKNAQVVAINGDTTVKSVTVKDAGGEVRDLAVDGVFIFVGMVPNTQLVADQILLTDAGYIETDEQMRVFAPQDWATPKDNRIRLQGVFAAGDVRLSVLRQAVTSAAEGAIAAVMAEKYLETLS